jgi:hypothetical protein
VRCGLQSSGPLTGSCEHGDEPSGSIRSGMFLDQLSDCQVAMKDSAA